MASGTLAPLSGGDPHASICANCYGDGAHDAGHDTAAPGKDFTKSSSSTDDSEADEQDSEQSALAKPVIKRAGAVANDRRVFAAESTRASNIGDSCGRFAGNSGTSTDYCASSDRQSDRYALGVRMGSTGEYADSCHNGNAAASRGSSESDDGTSGKDECVDVDRGFGRKSNRSNSDGTGAPRWVHFECHDSMTAYEDAMT